MRRLQTGDAIVEPQIKRRSLRHFAVNVRVVIQEIPEPGREVTIAQHEEHRGTARLFGDSLVVQIAGIHFGNVARQRPQIFH